MLSCYQERPSCVDDDFNQEVSQYSQTPLLSELKQRDEWMNHCTCQVEYLFTNIHNFKHFIIDWLEFSEKIGNLATEGELELWGRIIRISMNLFLFLVHIST